MTETHKTNHHLNDQTASNANPTHSNDLQQKYTKANLSKPEKYYAIVRGKQTGIYTSWFECADYVINYSGAKFKSFKNLNDAETYVTMHNTKNKTQHHSIETHNPYITPPPSLTRHTTSPNIQTVATPHADELVTAVTFTPPITHTVGEQHTHFATPHWDKQKYVTKTNYHKCHKQHTQGNSNS